MERMDTSRLRLTGLALVGLMACSLACGGGGSSAPPTAPTPPPVTTPPPAPTPPPATAALSTLALASASVVGGSPTEGTVTLTAAAAAGGAVVTLSSSGSQAAVPATVTVAAGATTATFPITTTSVQDTQNLTITATFSGVTRTAALAVTRVPLVPRFIVTSASRGADACALLEGGNTIDCTFDGRASTGPITEWRWEYFVGATRGFNSSSEGTTRPMPGCNFFRDQQVSRDGGVEFLQMEVRLVVADARGVTSDAAINRNVRVFPNRNCGYGF